jgi:hypothetical protein
MKLRPAISLLGRFALMAAGLSTIWGVGSVAQGQDRPGRLVGERAPEFHIQGIYNEAYSLQSFKGHILVMQFGTSW